MRSLWVSSEKGRGKEKKNEAGVEVPNYNNDKQVMDFRKGGRGIGASPLSGRKDEGERKKADKRNVSRRAFDSHNERYEKAAHRILTWGKKQFLIYSCPEKEKRT